MRERSFPSFEIIAGSSVEEVDINIKDMLPGLFQGRTKKRRVKVAEAMDHLLQEEQQKLVDMESVARVAVERVEDGGIIFVDEIDLSLIHISEPTRLGMISYAVFCLKKKKK